MHTQLEAILSDYEAASARLRGLASAVGDARWTVRADPARWSAAECIAHLVLTARAFLPLVDGALAEARALHDRGVAAPARYRRDFAGWLLWRTAGPPARLRVRTTAAFVPEAVASREAMVTDFDVLQAAQIERVRAADGLPIDRVRIRSPFDSRVRYNLYACFTILPRHEHRHLWQAERVWAGTKAAGGG